MKSIYPIYSSAIAALTFLQPRFQIRMDTFTQSLLHFDLNQTDSSTNVSSDFIFLSFITPSII